MDEGPSTVSASAPQRLDWVDAAKGLAMLMVIAYHVTAYVQTAGVDAVLGRAKAVFELFPMPAFFLAAGLFAARHAESAFPALWRDRLLSLLYLYVVWSVVRTVFYLVVPGLNGELGEIPATDPLALPLILFWPSSSYWFLYALFLFTLVRWLIAGLPVWVQVAGSGAVSAVFTSRLVETGNLGWDRVGALFFFFVLGAVFSRQLLDLVPAARPIHLGVALAAFGVSAALILLGLRGLPPVVLVGQLAAVAVGLLFCRFLLRFRVSRLLSSIGRASLSLYLLHLFIVVSATALLDQLDPAWPRWVDVGVQVSLTLVTLVGAFGLARLTSRVTWLYVPPAFLRGARGEPVAPEAEVAEAEAGLTGPAGAAARPPGRSAR
ncbi:acyltransferase family protein [Candidatus Blastococcus massiliensis]|uniref:acyltransferase family protein n=1 Tax=Candidatus Blastococcus massiliensis TaxID=1470358 RepID=UPI0004AF05C3|nr:acyltransferase [Candidatus Blastococcus massiliensis]